MFGCAGLERLPEGTGCRLNDQRRPKHRSLSPATRFQSACLESIDVCLGQKVMKTMPSIKSKTTSRECRNPSECCNFGDESDLSALFGAFTVR